MTTFKSGQQRHRQVPVITLTFRWVTVISTNVQDCLKESLPGSGRATKSMGRDLQYSWGVQGGRRGGCGGAGEQRRGAARQQLRASAAAGAIGKPGILPRPHRGRCPQLATTAHAWAAWLPQGNGSCRHIRQQANTERTVERRFLCQAASDLKLID